MPSRSWPDAPACRCRRSARGFKRKPGRIRTLIDRHGPGCRLPQGTTEALAPGHRLLQNADCPARSPPGSASATRRTAAGRICSPFFRLRCRSRSMQPAWSSITTAAGATTAFATGSCSPSSIQGRHHRLRRVIRRQGEPKYLNSPETPLFERAVVQLFGLPRPATPCGNRHRDRDRGLYGRHCPRPEWVGNAVATLGTATTATHHRSCCARWDRIVFASTATMRAARPPGVP